MLLLLAASAMAACGAPDEDDLLDGDANAGDDGATENTNEHQDALDASKALGTTAEDMVAMQPVLAAFGDYVAALRDALPESFADAEVLHQPQLALRVAFVGDVPAQAETLKPAALANANVELLGGARYSEVAGQARADAVHQALRDQGYRGIGTSFDGFEGRVESAVAAVPGGSAKLADISAAKAVADALGDTEVRLLPASGFASQAPVRGGANITPLCTSGFVVHKGKERGLSTAAHCGATHYAGPGTDWLLTKKSSHAGQWGDVAVYTTAGNEVASFFAGDGDGPRPVTAVRTPASMIKGFPVCFNGRVTKFDCSHVANVNRSCDFPDDSAGTLGRLVQMEDDITEKGDSGGPWFLGFEAWGVHAGTCGGSVFTKAANIDNATGWKVLKK